MTIPWCCKLCTHLSHEYGEFGVLLCPEYCSKHIRFPTTKKTCKKQQKDSWLLKKLMNSCNHVIQHPLSKGRVNSNP